MDEELESSLVPKPSSSLELSKPGTSRILSGMVAETLELARETATDEPEKWFQTGEAYYYGLGVPQDYAEAAKWYRKAADQGHADAQFSLGLMYASGRGVTQKDTQGTMWFRKAASTQHTLFDLMDRNGQGVSQDYAEAVKWYRKAAEQGHAKAQFNLGVMYDNGQGVSQDDAEAAKWFRKAAEQGYADAQFNLGWMYAPLSRSFFSPFCKHTRGCNMMVLFAAFSCWPWLLRASFFLGIP